MRTDRANTTQSAPLSGINEAGKFPQVRRGVVLGEHEVSVVFASLAP